MTTIEKLKAALDRHPRVLLLEEPTPVRKLARAFPGREVWLKDDSQTNPSCGGNKARKLEYLIAKAKARKQGVVTFGFESSNHALATAYHCSCHQVPCHLILVRGPQGLCPEDEASRIRKLALMQTFATSIETTETYPGAARLGTRRWLKGMGRIRLIPPGGSNGLGTLGYVRGALELAEQIARGELPVPKTIFVPLGTGGTAVGIAVGIAAAGLDTRINAIKVVPGKVNELPRLKWIARQVGRLLPEFPREALRLSNLTVEPSALGTGYGAPTGEGMRAVARWLEIEKVQLEATYSGKAAAALERWEHENGAAAGPVLFWLTYSEFKGSILP